LVLALLGNFVGGGLVIGLGYAWLNRTKSIYKD
nr:formate-nitrite transporter [Listeria monocytogenes]